MEKEGIIGELRTILHEECGLESNRPEVNAVADTLTRFFSILNAIDRQTANTGSTVNEIQRFNSVLQ